MSAVPLIVYAPWVLVTFYGVLGFLFGGYAERKTYCMVVATHRVMGLRYDRIYEIILVSLAVAALGTGLLVASGAVPIDDAFAFLPGAGWFTLLGAFIFGFGIMLGQGCMVGMLWKSGAGYVVNWFEILGLVCGTIIFAFPLFNWMNLDYWWHTNTSVSIANGSASNYVPSLLGGSAGAAAFTGIIFFAGIMVVALTLRKRRISAEGPSTESSGKKILSSPYFVGSVFAAFMVASFIFGAGHLFNYLGVTTPIGLFSEYLLAPFGVTMGGTAYSTNWFQLKGIISPFSFFILMLLSGSAIFSMARGSFKVRGPAGSVNRGAEFLIAFVGGMILAIGARIAQGCSVGGFWSGIAGLSIFGLVFTIGIIPGTIAGYYTYLALSGKASGSKHRNARKREVKDTSLQKASGYIFSILIGLGLIGIGRTIVSVNGVMAKPLSSTALPQESTAMIGFGIAVIVMGLIANTYHLLRKDRATVKTKEVSIAGHPGSGGAK